MLGEIKGTPTIRLFKPKPKQQPGKHSSKIVLDYNNERKAVDMKRFTDYSMPNFVEEIVHGAKDFDKFQAKAVKNGLPQALLFPSKSATMPLTKFLSTQFRRKMLIGEVKPNVKNKEILEKFGVTDLPALIVIPVNAPDKSTEEKDFVRFEGEKKDFTRLKLDKFLSSFALKQIKMPPLKNEDEKEKATKEEPKKKTGTSSAKEEL